MRFRRTDSSACSRLGLVVVGLVALACIGATATPASTPTSGSADFSLSPARYDPANPVTRSYFVIEAQPGQVVHQDVIVGNAGTISGTALLYPVDATTGQTSGAVYLNKDTPRSGVGSWIKIDQTKLTLDAGKKQQVSFTITVPKDVSPGEHLGGLVAENTKLTTPDSKNALQINIQRRTVVAVQVNIPGPRVEKLAITGVKPGQSQSRQTLLLGLSNQGNVFLKPSGSMKVMNAAGDVVKTFPMKLDTFLPQTSIDYPLAVQGKPLGPGDYLARVHFDYGHGKAADADLHFTISEEQAAAVATASAADPPSADPPVVKSDSGTSIWLISGIAGAAVVLAGLGGFVLAKRQGR